MHGEATTTDAKGRSRKGEWVNGVRQKWLD